MSVSFREKVAKALHKSGWVPFLECDNLAGELLSLLPGKVEDLIKDGVCLACGNPLFPPQLTEEEVEKILKSVDENPYCSKLGLPARRKHYVDALIGKCATPTFSGGNGYDNDGNPIQYGISGGATEQKESQPFELWCEHNKNIQGKYTRCLICNPYALKPIPAEKKECEHEWELTCVCMINRNYPPVYKCKKCQEYKPESKPKDRIEPLPIYAETLQYKDSGWDITMMLWNKLQELIRHINKES